MSRKNNVDKEYEWREVYEELKLYISEVKKNGSREDKYKALRMCYNFIYDVVHEKLAKNLEVRENEKNIREICRYVIQELLPIVKKDIEEIDYYIRCDKEKNIELAREYKEYLDLEDDLYALASYRSLTHFAHYMERYDDKSQLVWKYNMSDTMGGIFYYSNAMILDNKYSNLIKQCPTGYGKCVDENTMVMTNKGYVRIKEVNVGDLIYSYSSGNLVKEKITNKWNTQKKYYSIKTQSGRTIKISPEHRMLTQEGYKQGKDLTTKDYFYSLLSKIDGYNEINQNELIFIVGMIFEGSCTENIFSFTQEDNEFKDVFLKACDNLGITYNISKMESKAKTYWFHKANGKVRELLKKYGVYDCNSHTKKLSKQFFDLPLKQKYDFISIMLATDGYVPKGDIRELAGICLANEHLIDDIQLLLSTCGIYSKKSYKKVKLNGKFFDSWRLEIPNEYINEIYDNCYLYHKQDRLEERYNIINSKNTKPYCNRTNYPKELLINCKEFKKKVNKQWSRNKTFKREIVEKFNNETHLLEDIVYKDFVCDKIISIEYKEEEINMVDIEVNYTHNFVANGFVSHNSKSDCIIISFCFGYDVNDDIMKVVGNKQLVKPLTQAIVKMLKSKGFGKVFPEFGKYNGENSMFKNCAETDGTFTLADSKKALSFACYNKETSIDGGRFNKQFYDDVTQSDDRENVKAHKKDWGRYESQWKKRQYDEFSCLRWFTGTAYHREDFISRAKVYYANNRELIKDSSASKMKWSKFVKLSEDRKTVYISVPKLADLELGEKKCYCTFPQKYSKEEALKELHSSDTAIRRFMAMEQQQPLPPESLAFDWVYLKQYEELPQKIKDGDCETLVIIDPNRKGRDNYAGLIFKKPNDINDDHWYFVDCFYKKVSSKIAIPKICERASHHKADRIAFETNTVDSYQMKKEIKENMLKYGWKEYKVSDFYSTLNKEEKISKYRDDIRDKIVFPHRTMYYPDSDMGRALADITNYSFDVKNLNDDSIDCCAMLMIVGEKKTGNSIQALDIYL